MSINAPDGDYFSPDCGGKFSMFNFQLGAVTMKASEHCVLKIEHCSGMVVENLGEME